MSARIRGWRARSHPPQASPASLHRSSIYIFPTRGGGWFGLLMLIMLLAAMNYSNSLGFVLTFLLTGLGLVAMHHTHRNLLNLQLSARRADPVFAGEAAHFPIAIHNPTRTARLAVRLRRGKKADPVMTDIAVDKETTVAITVPARSRGRLALPRLRIDTVYPMGLFCAWSQVALRRDCLVYPRPAGQRPLPSGRSGDEADSGANDAGNEDFAGLRRYQKGDPPRSIHWKSYPHSGKLMVKQFTSGHAQTLWLDWWLLTDLATEPRLSQLAQWVLDSDAAGQPYGLRLPDATIAPGCGPGQRHRCLRVLALYGHAR